MEASEGGMGQGVLRTDSMMSKHSQPLTCPYSTVLGWTSTVCACVPCTTGYSPCLIIPLNTNIVFIIPLIPYINLKIIDTHMNLVNSI